MTRNHLATAATEEPGMLRKLTDFYVGEFKGYRGVSQLVVVDAEEVEAYHQEETRAWFDTPADQQPTAEQLAEVWQEVGQAFTWRGSDYNLAADSRWEDIGKAYAQVEEDRYQRYLASDAGRAQSPASWRSAWQAACCKDVASPAHEVAIAPSTPVKIAQSEATKAKVIAELCASPAAANAAALATHVLEPGSTRLAGCAAVDALWR